MGDNYDFKRFYDPSFPICGHMDLLFGKRITIDIYFNNYQNTFTDKNCSEELLHKFHNQMISKGSALK